MKSRKLTMVLSVILCCMIGAVFACDPGTFTCTTTPINCESAHAIAAGAQDDVEAYDDLLEGVAQTAAELHQLIYDCDSGEDGCDGGHQGGGQWESNETYLANLSATIAQHWVAANEDYDEAMLSMVMGVRGVLWHGISLLVVRKLLITLIWLTTTL